jgi:hypothetical protein
MKENSNSAGSTLVNIKAKENLKVLIYLKSDHCFVEVGLVSGETMSLSKDEFKQNRAQNPDFEKQIICQSIPEVAA